jgi:hypothetical protein
VGDDLLIDVGGDTLHARDLLDGGLHRLADGVDLAERGIAQLHVQAHVTVVHPHVAGRAAGEEIPAGIGINDGGQRLIDGVDSNTHDGIGYRNSVKGAAPDAAVLPPADTPARKKGRQPAQPC